MQLTRAKAPTFSKLPEDRLLLFDLQTTFNDDIPFHQSAVIRNIHEATFLKHDSHILTLSLSITY